MHEFEHARIVVWYFQAHLEHMPSDNDVNSGRICGFFVKKEGLIANLARNPPGSTWKGSNPSATKAGLRRARGTARRGEVVG